MTYAKRASGIVLAVCDRCDDRMTGTREFLSNDGWSLLYDDERTACCGDCMEEIEDEGKGCPGCGDEMDVDTLIHMSSAGPVGVSCFVCDCGEKMPVAKGGGDRSGQ